MARLKVKLEFPCGMKCEIYIRAIGHPSYQEKDLECPLHGKDCKTSQKIEERRS